MKEYYISIFGNPSREAEYVTSDSVIKVYKWLPGVEDVTMYITEYIINDVIVQNKSNYEFFIGLTPQC